MMNLDEMYATALVNRQTREPIDVMRDGTERLHLAQADDFTQMATEMAGGTEPEGAQPMSLRQFAETAADVPAGLLKGAIQGTPGILGDVESLAYGVREIIRRGADESVLDAFLRGLETNTIMPTTEEVKKWLDENVSPLVPEGADPRRVEAAKTAEFVGELGGAGGTIAGIGKTAIRGVKQIGREMVTTAPTGQVQLAPTPVQAPRSKLGFYSAVEETVANLPQAKGTGQQFLAQISKTAGVKPEEIKWTGLDEFLKGKKSVTKQEVQDYLNANRVDVQEVRLEASTGQRIPLTNEEQARLNVLREREQTEGLGGLEAEEYSDLLNKEIAFEEFYDKTRFSDYTLPGGENYREILLTLPKMGDGGEANWVPGLGRVSRPHPDARQAPAFTSSHFDQPNILAHLRVNDRTVDGKKTLFVEEIQSDWHQAGRKRGYDDPRLKAKRDELMDKADEVAKKAGFINAAHAAEGWQMHDIPQAKEAHDLWLAAVRQGPNPNAVPDAPFKTSWHELSLKRAIQEAAEKGYDQIAFTTGKTQVERYPEALRQVADNISWRASGTPESGNRSIEIKKSGNTVLQAQVDNRGIVISASNQEAIGKPIEDLIGKPMGQQVIAEPSGSIKGEQFTVGGKGMEGFYDNILPKSLDKLGKKFGAKVGKTEMDGVEVWQMDITPKMRESVVSKGQPLFVAPIAAPGMMQQEETK